MYCQLVFNSISVISYIEFSGPVHTYKSSIPYIMHQMLMNNALKDSGKKKIEKISGTASFNGTEFLNLQYNCIPIIF